MPPAELNRLLLALAKSLGIEVRSEPFPRQAFAAGGLCSLRGRRVILVDANASRVDRIATLADALSQLELSAVRLDPALSLVFAACRARQRWREGHRSGGSPRRTTGVVRWLRRPQPGVRPARPRLRL